MGPNYSIKMENLQEDTLDGTTPTAAPDPEAVEKII